MRFILFVFFLLTLLALSCQKEPLQFTGNKSTVFFNNTNKYPDIDPNCTLLNPNDFPPTGDALGRIVINGRITFPDGSRKSGIQVVLTKGFFQRNYFTKTDAAGRFKFDEVADTAAGIFYSLGYDVNTNQNTYISRFNCQRNIPLVINRIQTVDISFCEASTFYIKAVKKTDSDSVGFIGSAVDYCDRRPQSYGYATTKMETLITFVGQNKLGAAYVVVKNSLFTITIERIKNGVKTYEAKAYLADSLTKTITLEL
jgi:hypothetical protein